MTKESADYDKQYQEDLERAQALSLESLALEQFKNKKKLKDVRSSAPTRNLSGNVEQYVL